MKIKFTPLVIVSVGLLISAIYFTFEIVRNEKGGNLGGLVVLVCIFTAAISLFLSLGLRKVFKTHIVRQVLLELVLIVIVAFLYYKNTGKLILHLPPDFKGYIIVVYGADKKPELPANLFKANTNITVPNSGIIMTSSERNKVISVVDSSDDRIRTIKAGYGIPFVWDSLICGNKKYELDVLVFDSLPTGWLYKNDTLMRNVKKELACKVLNE